MSDAPLPNSPEARTETGELKPVITPTAETKPVTEPTTTTPAPTPSEPEPKKEEPAAGPPEKYEFAAPEGYEIDEKFAGEASAVFKELGLSQDAASKLVKMYTDKIVADADAPYRKYEEIRTGWRNDVVGDPALGNGTDLKPEVKAQLGRAIDAMGAKESAAFREAMELTGAGDNPAVIRGLLALAKRTTEGTAVRGSGPAPVRTPGAPTSAAKALFPNLP